jgi:hypothetical protein
LLIFFFIITPIGSFVVPGVLLDQPFALSPITFDPGGPVICLGSWASSSVRFLHSRWLPSQSVRFIFSIRKSSWSHRLLLPLKLASLIAQLAQTIRRCLVYLLPNGYFSLSLGYPYYWSEPPFWSLQLCTSFPWFWFSYSRFTLSLSQSSIMGYLYPVLKPILDYVVLFLFLWVLLFTLPQICLLARWRSKPTPKVFLVS